MVDTREQCEAFVRAMRYPPLGERSFGPARGLLYGGDDYAKRANETLLSWAMIETKTALANVEEIAQTEGLSGLYIGPSDLSMTLEGSIATPLSPHIAKEIRRIIAVAHSHRLRVGIFCPDVGFAREMASLGCDLITVMNDAGLLRRATGALLADLRLPVPEEAYADVV
jgi:4-hydroxy-2-oxoheptanedioate aldolase